MRSSAYVSVYIEDCIRKGHHFSVIGSDKTPLKRSLTCKECSGSGFTANLFSFQVADTGKGESARKESDER